MRIGNSIWELCETGGFIKVGIVKMGIDGEYVIWFA